MILLISVLSRVAGTFKLIHFADLLVRTHAHIDSSVAEEVHQLGDVYQGEETQHTLAVCFLGERKGCCSPMNFLSFHPELVGVAKSSR